MWEFNLLRDKPIARFRGSGTEVEQKARRFLLDGR